MASLHVYPVKSLAGISLPASQLLPTGLPHDRQWMLVSGAGRFLTQREAPRMALIRTELTGVGVRLSLSGQGSMELPQEPRPGRRSRVRVWKDECEVLDQGDAASRWLGLALGLDPAPRIVRMAPGRPRPQSHPERYGEQTTTLFADGAPYLVANEASLSALNEALARRGREPVPMNRFRPNVVLRGPAPFAEHRVRRLDGGDFTLALRHPCARCLITTIDQDSGVPHPDREPFVTLRRINPMPDRPGEAAFGENAVLLSGRQRAAPTLRVGQRLRIDN